MGRTRNSSFLLLRWLMESLSALSEFFFQLSPWSAKFNSPFKVFLCKMFVAFFEVEVSAGEYQVLILWLKVYGSVQVHQGQFCLPCFCLNFCTDRI